MASKSSKALPFVVLAMAFTLAIIEVQTGKHVPIDELLPILAAVGVAGVPLAAAKKFAEAIKGARTVVTKTVEQPPAG